MTERRRPIVLDEEVREPRERIWGKQRNEDQPIIAHDKPSNQESPSDQSANGMKYARKRLTMREHVEGPEFGEGVWIGHAGILA